MIKLNCDMGEHFGIWQNDNDEKIIPYIDIANLACGFHSSDPLNMLNSVSLIKQYNKELGAHPSYPDLVGFGRRSMKCTQNEIKALILYQLGALNGICKNFDTELKYLKPHGALYNDMMKDLSIFESIVQATSDFDKNIKMFILSTSQNSKFQDIANKYDIQLMFEVFMDRHYSDEGLLVSRHEINCLVSDMDTLRERLKTILNDGFLYSNNRKKLFLQTDTICVHSDSPSSLEFIKEIYRVLQNSRS